MDALCAGPELWRKSTASSSSSASQTTLSSSSSSMSRPLGPLEHKFFLDSQLSGQTDTFSSFILSPSTSTIESKRFELAWQEILKLNPLLGATIRVREGSRPEFVYELDEAREEERKQVIVRELEGEGNFASLMDDFLSSSINGLSEFLNEKCLARLVVLRRGKEKEVGVVFFISHVVSDGQSLFRLLQDFLNLLEKPLPSPPLTESQLLDRLPLSTESLYPTLPLQKNNSKLIPSRARKRWFWAIQVVLRELEMNAAPTNVITFDRKVVESKEVISVWDLVSFDAVVTKKIMRLAKKNGMSPSMLLYGMVNVAVSNLPSLQPHPTSTLPNPTIVIGFPLSIRPFLATELSQRNQNDLAIRLGFGGITLPFTPCSGEGEGERTRKLVVLGAKLALEQFEKRLIGVERRGRFLASQRLNGIERLGTEMKVEGFPVAKRGAMSIAASMVGDVDRLLAQSFRISPTEIVKVSQLRVGTRLHAGEMLMEVFKFNGLMEVTIGYDSLRVEPKIVRELLEEVLRVGKKIVEEEEEEKEGAKL